MAAKQRRSGTLSSVLFGIVAAVVVASEDSHVNGPVKRKQILAELWTLD
ncbi:MAG TPA: hypothetical protein VIR57_23340 [Chloroflexota bacterium]|jgi:hypothetical protein